MPFGGFPVFLRSPRAPLGEERSAPLVGFRAPSGLRTPSLTAVPATARPTALRTEQPGWRQRVLRSAMCTPGRRSDPKRAHRCAGRHCSPPEHSLALQRIELGQLGPPSDGRTRSGAEAPARVVAPLRVIGEPISRRVTAHGVATPRAKPAHDVSTPSASRYRAGSDRAPRGNPIVTRALSQPLRVCFTPDTLLGFSPSGAYSVWRAGSASPPPFLPCRWLRPPSGASTHEQTSPRLRRLDLSRRAACGRPKPTPR
jgi:hypothetical protein